MLVDQDRCRGWRQCVTGCPYKKIYFNHKTGKAEKCTFCYPRVEVGLPTVCSETCVGRLRYLGLFLYDVDAVTAAASTPNPQDLYQAQLDLLLDPNDPAVIAGARASGIPPDWMEAARRSPVYALAKKYKVALPLHPEYRTMPMVWYIPPLSPIVDLLRDQGHDAESSGVLFGAIEALRIPVEYLAELFTAVEVQRATQLLEVMGLFGVGLRDHISLFVLGDGEQPVHRVHLVTGHPHRGRDRLVARLVQRDVPQERPHRGQGGEHALHLSGVTGGEQLGQILQRDPQLVDRAEQDVGALRVVPLVTEEVDDRGERRDVPDHRHGPVLRVEGQCHLVLLGQRVDR